MGLLMPPLSIDSNIGVATQVSIKPKLLALNKAGEK
jgi:hypothetical protein